MSLPGDIFFEAAFRQGQAPSLATKQGLQQALQSPELRQLLRDCLYSTGGTKVLLRYRERLVPLDVISGHLWCSARTTGPQRAEVMLIGKHPGPVECNLRANFSGESGKLLWGALLEAGVNPSSWYVTNLVKTVNPQPSEKTLSDTYTFAWKHLLEQEIRLVRPRYILCLGAEAAKALLGKSAVLKRLEGQVLAYRFSLGVREHECLVMATVNPARVLQEPRDKSQFLQAVQRFARLTRGERWDVEARARLQFVTVRTQAELERLEQIIRQECRHNRIAVDAEWTGDHPQNAGSYLRCLGLSWCSFRAAAVVLRDTRGQWAFDVPPQQVYAVLRRIFSERVLVGHFFASDAEWLEADGLRVADLFWAPRQLADYRQRVLSGQPCGIDTAFVLHAVDETQPLGLKIAARVHADYPRWDEELQQWLKSGPKDEECEGYGQIPDEILLPYQAYDASATWDLLDRLLPQLDRDAFGQNVWEPVWRNMLAFPAVLEMNTTGIPINRQRLAHYIQVYQRASARLLQELRDWAQWPEFNPASVFEVREFLFGEALNGKRPAAGAAGPVRLRPPGAKSLYLRPVLAAGKRKLTWDEVESKGWQAEKSPSTDKTALALLSREAERVQVRQSDGQTVTLDLSQPVKLLRNFRFISQALKLVLRPPEPSETAGEEDEEEPVYEKGLPGMICDDGRIRTYLTQVKETGRWSSSRPNMQAISKRREREYKRILGEDYPGPLRALFEAPPGYVLVEADYIGAELMGMAICSGDPRMLEHAQRSFLPEDHPDYFDIHSNLTVRAFQLKCEPKKSALAAAGYGGLRDVGKCVAGKTRLLTDRGWLEMGRLCRHVPEGKSLAESGRRLRVCGPGGTSWLVARHHLGVGRALTIRTEFGYELTCSLEHQVLTPEGLREAGALRVGQRVGLICGGAWEFSGNFFRPAAQKNVWENRGRELRCAVERGQKNAVENFLQEILLTSDAELQAAFLHGIFSDMRGELRLQSDEQAGLLQLLLLSAGWLSERKRRGEQAVVRVGEKPSRGLQWLEVRQIQDAGDCPLFDVEVSEEQQHLVCYDGFATHQCVVFGTGYGLTPEGVVIQAREEGVDATLEDAEELQNYFLHEMYPGLPKFFEAARARGSRERWGKNCWGQVRHMAPATDAKQRGEREREMGNFYVQSLVAWAVSQACVAFMDVRRQLSPERLDFKFLLQIHDALLFLVRVEHVGLFMERVVPFCMRDCVPIWRCDLEGRRTGEGPYYLSPEVSCYRNWGETPLPDVFLPYGVSPEVAHWKWSEEHQGWLHKSYAGKVWRAASGLVPVSDGQAG